MKVLHVSIGDSGAGASRAAYRIHRSLAESGIDSRMRVLHRNTNDPTVIAGRPVIPRVFQKVHHYYLQVSHKLKGWHTDNRVYHSFGQTGAGLVDELNSCDANLINLHWIPGMLSVKDIGKLKKPIVWTLHDMWAFCGGEHYAPDDTLARFRIGYLPGNQPSWEKGPDLNRKTWDFKRKAWEQKSFTVVGSSRWMSYCARESVIFKGADILTINYPLDLKHVWQPVPRDEACKTLNLPMDKTLILMGAIGGLADHRKGGDLFHDAINQLIKGKLKNAELVIFGKDTKENSYNWPCPVYWLGNIQDDGKLAMVYSAAHVTVVPSRQETLGQTALEAQACGTPVVAFNIGGLPDVVIHRETGWLANPFDTEELAHGIRWVLEDSVRRSALSRCAREKVVERFSLETIAGQYVQVYEEVLR